MLTIFNGWRKYLLVVAILIIAAFCMYLRYAFAESENRIVYEQAWEKQQDVSLLGVIVDTLVEMDMESGNSYGYEKVLKTAMRYIETSYTSTFAQVYNDRLNPLMETSPGVGGGQKHNPLDYPEFIEAVTNNESGSLTYWYETQQAGGREIHMTYRWVPSDTNHTTRYLIAVGISKYTIKERTSPLVQYGAIALVIVASVYIMGCTVWFCRCGVTKSAGEEGG